ncbi:Holliday junction resolvase RecU [Pseudobutyrivibrio sp.]|uniref:Holliday junction resolvase RecU n=1 Tax=Pseudobutyrivibrio sp. TaxID=2014367 RepID=UPI003869B106
MSTFKSRGLRGSTFEEFINKTNLVYEENGLALIQKIPTPITPIDMDSKKGHITLAYFDQKSTVDYVGAIQGIPVCFDAKECNKDTFPLQNIHQHQIDFMEKWEKQDGIAFILIFFSERDLYYYLPFVQLKTFWDRMVDGGRKSFRIDELDEKYFFETKPNLLVPYLDMINIDLKSRES